MKIVYCDSLVIGGGLAGLRAAVACQEKGLTKEEMIRGLFFSHMTTIHIKSNIGRLSAYCGAMCASAGVAGAISFLSGLKYALVSNPEFTNSNPSITSFNLIITFTPYFL